MTTATPIEVRKIAYRQSAKDGLVITFSVHPNDMPAALAAAPIGARFMAALVEIGDDETPVTPPEPEMTKAVKEKRNWNELPPATQSAIRCGEPSFIQFMKENYPTRFNADVDIEPMPTDASRAANAVRLLCKVKSRSELSTNHAACDIWRTIEAEYFGWQRGME